MGVISVDSSSLAWLGADSERLARTVVSAAPGVSGGFSATSAAVQALHREVDNAARRIAVRLQLTGLFLAEIGFTSVLVGFGSQFRGADEHGINVLRRLQLRMGSHERYLLFRESATYPWIERPQ